VDSIEIFVSNRSLISKVTKKNTRQKKIQSILKEDFRHRGDLITQDDISVVVLRVFNACVPISKFYGACFSLSKSNPFPLCRYGLQVSKDCSSYNAKDKKIIQKLNANLKAQASRTVIHNEKFF